MRFKLFPTASRVAALLLLSVAGTAAQVLQISGKVTLKQPAGSVMPVEGADVDISPRRCGVAVSIALTIR